MDEGHSEVKCLGTVSLVPSPYTLLCPFPQSQS